MGFPKELGLSFFVYNFASMNSMNSIIQANVSQGGTTEQLVSSTSVVNNQSQEHNVAQATVPTIYGGKVTNQTTAEKDSKTEKASVSGTKKASSKKDYKPTYTDEETERLEHLTDICKEEIGRVIGNPRYHTTAYDERANSIINLRLAYQEGKIQLGTPTVNRVHGKDEIRTGESMMKYGPQHPLLVITKQMADESGLETTRFKNDEDRSQLPDDSLIIIDGNGRINYLLGLPHEQWPDIHAVFPSQDSWGYYNLCKAFDEINCQVTVWKTQDMVLKRLLQEGTKTHKAWTMINRLVNSGYKYQAACQWATLSTDRIPKKDVTDGDVKVIFSNHDFAIPIFESLKNKFGEGKDDALKTKALPTKVVYLWGLLCYRHSKKESTSIFINFINELTDENVAAITEAKSVKGGASRDEQRKQHLENSFKVYCKNNQINVEI